MPQMFLMDVIDNVIGSCDTGATFKFDLYEFM